MCYKNSRLEVSGNHKIHQAATLVYHFYQTNTLIIVQSEEADV
jgi:hypothetical protein